MLIIYFDQIYIKYDRKEFPVQQLGDIFILKFVIDPFLLFRSSKNRAEKGATKGPPLFTNTHIKDGDYDSFLDHEYGLTLSK